MQRIFFISHVGLPECQQVKTPNCTVTRQEFVKTRGTLVPDLPHMPAHGRQSGRQNIITRTHTWQQCSVYFNNKIRLQSQTEFTAKHRKQHRILWLDTSVCRACANRSAITEVGTLLKWHTLVPSPTIPLHSVAWLEKGRGNSLKCNRANFSARRSQSGGIPGSWLLR